MPISSFEGGGVEGLRECKIDSIGNLVKTGLLYLFISLFSLKSSREILSANDVQALFFL